jgi:type II secretory pathway component GspD/PulD (secretin)
VLNHIPTSNGTYLIRPGYIEVMTSERSYPDQQAVQGQFSKQPLADVIDELAEQTGISILIDPRVGAKAQTQVTVAFRGSTNLVTAVRLLADMADLKLIVVDKILYITGRSNNAVFPPAGDPDVGKRRVEAAV